MIEPSGRVYLEYLRNVRRLPREVLSRLFDECLLSPLHSHKHTHTHSLKRARTLTQESILSAFFGDAG